MKNKRAAFATVGCKVNMYDTEAMKELFINKGCTVVDFSEYADVYVINTCTVTNLGDKKSRQMIRRAKKQNPSACIVAAGCYAQVSPEDAARIDGVSIVIGTKDRSRLLDMIESYEETGKAINAVSDISSEKTFEPLKTSGMSGRTRAFLKIQDGCNRYCSFCIIPYARGPVRSRAPGEVLKEALALAENGFKEIVLTGIHVASYGIDLNDCGLLDVLRIVSEIDGIERIRLSSIEPVIITDEFVNALKGFNKLCGHFHLSLQSGCDKTLKAMRRRYTTEEYEKAAHLLRVMNPDVSITTDVIAGFPGETDDDFLLSYNFCERLQFAKIHVFPYSNKKGTKACTMPDQVEARIKNRRTKELLSLSSKQSRSFLQKFIGRRLPVLFEKNMGDGTYEGHTENYITVRAGSDSNIVNKVISVTILEIIDDETVYGVL